MSSLSIPPPRKCQHLGRWRTKWHDTHRRVSHAAGHRPFRKFSAEDGVTTRSLLVMRLSMSEDDTTSHSASTPHPPPDQPNAAEATAQEPSAARTVQRGEPDNGGERDSGSVEIEGAVKHAEACARAFKGTSGGRSGKGWAGEANGRRSAGACHRQTRD